MYRNIERAVRWLIRRANGPRTQERNHSYGAFHIAPLKRLPIKKAVALVAVVVAVTIPVSQFLLDDTGAADLPLNSKPRVVQVSSGGDHTCAIFNDGMLYCWGKNDMGQLGIGSNTNQSAPVSVMSKLPAGAKAKQVSAGLMHTCAVVSVPSGSDQVYCWGKNDNGQLGNGITLPVTTVNSQNRNVPTAVANPSGAVPTKVSAGFAHTCAVYDTGVAYCWGNNDEGQLGDGTGTFNSTSGLWTTKPTSRSAPQLVSGSTSSTDIATGATHTCATMGGQSYCWGGGGSSQFGNNSTNSSSTRQVTSSSTGTIASSSGFFSSCAIISDTARCWGDNTSGQIGNNTTTVRSTPYQVAGSLASKTVTNITSGYAHTCAVAGGELYCWGDNSSGQLLNNDSTYANKLLPTAVLLSNTNGVNSTLSGMVSAGGVITAKSVSGGFAHTCAIYGNVNDDSYNTLFCGGWNESGQLGAGNTTSNLVLTAVDTSKIVAVAGVEPNVGLTTGGASVEIKGHFPSASGSALSSVTFDGATCTNLTVTSTTTAICTTPAHTAGPVDITVTTADGQTTTLAGGYTYEDPYVNLNLDDNDLAIDLTPELNAGDGVVSSDKHTASFTSNSATGVVLSASTNTSHSNLVNLSDNSKTVSPGGGTLSSPATLGANSWGFALSDRTLESNNSNSTTTWAKVPNTSESLAIIKTTNTANPVTPSTVDVFYGAKINMAQQAGTYMTTVIYTAVPSP